MVIFNKFINNYELTLLNTANQKNSVTLSFSDFTNLMLTMGMCKFNHGEETDPEDFRLQQKIEIELDFLRKAWGILCGEEANESMTVDSNQLLTFLLAVLGLYDGEQDKVPEKIEVEPLEDIPESKEIKMKESVVKTKTNRIKKGRSKSIKNKKPKSKQFLMQNKYKSVKLDKTIKKEKEKPILEKKIQNINKFLPDIDFTKFGYPKILARKLKISFRYFYDLRSEFMYENKKKHQQSKNLSMSVASTGLKLSNKSSRNAENWRRKYLEKLQNENANNSDENSQDIRKNLTTNGKLNLEYMYRVIQKKKDNEINLKREKQIENELSFCTFQPNYEKYRNKSVNSRVSREVTHKLYTDALSKIENKNNTEENIDYDFRDNNKRCTFKPRINSVNYRIFESNPLESDRSVQRDKERLEKSRLEKKIKAIQIAKGVNNLKSIPNIKKLLEDTEEITQWNFATEHRSNKDFISVKTASKLTRPKFYEKRSRSSNRMDMSYRSKQPSEPEQVQSEDKINLSASQIMSGDNEQENEEVEEVSQNVSQHEEVVAEEKEFNVEEKEGEPHQLDDFGS